MVEQFKYPATNIYRNKAKRKLFHSCFSGRHGNKKRVSRHEAKTQFWLLTDFNNLFAKQVLKSWKSTPPKNLQALSLV